MKRETAKRLLDALNACKEIQELTGIMDQRHFLANRLQQLAVWKLVEIVGEALRQAELSEPAIARQITDLRLIIDTRNRLVHGYDFVEYDRLWDISQVDIPDLRNRLEVLMMDAPPLKNP